MKVSFLALAQQELDGAVAWYNEQVTGLGQEFLDELDRVVRRAVIFLPEQALLFILTPSTLNTAVVYSAFLLWGAVSHQ